MNISAQRKNTAGLIGLWNGVPSPTIKTVAVALCFSLIVTSSMAQEILLQSRSSVSSRSAIFEDDERVAYLYLTGPGSKHLEKDVIVYMRITPIDRAEFDALRRAKSTPLLLREVASDEAVVTHPDKKEFSFRWSRDGHAVAILRNGIPLAFASAAEQFGYAKAVSTLSPFANPWDQIKYASLFAE